MASHTSRPCQYRGCGRAAIRYRTLAGSDARLWYCDEHDPLADDRIAELWSATTESYGAS
jgi:hypothetical protein